MLPTCRVGQLQIQVWGGPIYFLSGTPWQPNCDTQGPRPAAAGCEQARPGAVVCMGSCLCVSGHKLAPDAARAQARVFPRPSKCLLDGNQAPEPAKRRPSTEAAARGPALGCARSPKSQMPLCVQWLCPRAHGPAMPRCRGGGVCPVVPRSPELSPFTAVNEALLLRASAQSNYVSKTAIKEVRSSAAAASPDLSWLARRAHSLVISLPLAKSLLPPPSPMAAASPSEAPQRRKARLRLLSGTVPKFFL